LNTFYCNSASAQQYVKQIGRMSDSDILLTCSTAKAFAMAIRNEINGNQNKSFGL
jgi:hypothetical protein